MKDYFKPDTRWKSFGASTLEKYIELFVIRGHFHDKVPDDILKDYEIVEYLMACAWYYFPIYDEALKKILHMVEMAVKIRCSQQNIDKYLVNKNKVKREKTLKQLMDDLNNAEPKKAIHEEFEKARKARNILSHPDRHAFRGGIMHSSIMQVANIINYIFLTECFFSKSKEILEKIQNEASGFNNGCFVLTYQNKKYLSYGSNCLEVWEKDDEVISFWVFYPVVTNIKEELETQNYSQPIYLSLSKLFIQAESFEAIDINSNQLIKFYKTDKQENTSRVKKFNEDLTQIEEEFTKMYFTFLDIIMGNKLVEHRYNNYWK